MKPVIVFKEWLLHSWLYSVSTWQLEPRTTHQHYTGDRTWYRANATSTHTTSEHAWTKMRTSQRRCLRQRLTWVVTYGLMFLLKSSTYESALSPPSNWKVERSSDTRWCNLNSFIFATVVVRQEMAPTQTAGQLRMLSRALSPRGGGFVLTIDVWFSQSGMFQTAFQVSQVTMWKICMSM